MLNGISAGASNSVQAFTAVNAFKNSQEALKKDNFRVEDNTPSGVDLKDNNRILKDQDVEDIRKYAKIAGEDNLTNEDIKYGLTYGRSVIAEYII